METGAVVAIMFHITFGIFSDTDTYVGAYRNLEVCRARIVELDKERDSVIEPHYFRAHRYCRLDGVQNGPAPK